MTDWVDALHRTKVRAEGDLMNALLRARGRVAAADQREWVEGKRSSAETFQAPEPEPAVVADWDAGPRAPAALPPAGMNDLLRAHVAAHRRRPLPEDYQ